MKPLYATATAATASLLLACGCFTPKYDKIPLERNEIPYVLADGDYTDVEGNVHKDQHNVWAMQEADVYDYVRSLVPSKKKRGVMDRIRSIKSGDVKTFALGALALLCAVLGIRLKLSKTKHEHHEEAPQNDEFEGE